MVQLYNECGVKVWRSWMLQVLLKVPPSKVAEVTAHIATCVKRYATFINALL